MKTIAAQINNENYYLKVGFEVASFVTGSMQADGFLNADGMPTNPGRLALGTLAVASQDNHPDLDWVELVESLPPSSWHEVWSAFDMVLELINELFPEDGDGQHPETSDPIDIFSDSYVNASGGVAA